MAVRKQRADARCRLKTVQARHDHIAEKNVRAPGLSYPDSARAIVHTNGIETALIEDLFESPGDYLLIIRNEDSRLRSVR